jgi:hypothetical protein
MFVQGGEGAERNAFKLAHAIGMKFGLDRTLLDGLLAIVSGNFNVDIARSMAPALMGKSDSSQSATDAICSLVGLAQGDFQQIKPIAIKMGGFDEKQLEALISGIAKLKPILDKIKKKAEKAKTQLKGELTFDADTQVDPTSLFIKYDYDKSGELEFNEFFEIVKMVQYPRQITESHVMKIFVKADVSETAALNMSEFKEALILAQKDQSNRVLELMGLSKLKMVMMVVSLLVILMLLFGFIFAGIFAFTTLGGFSAVINSTFPVIGGVGASGSRETPGSGEEGENSAMLERKLDQAVNEETVSE